MKRDLPSIIKKVAQFLDKTFSEDQVNELMMIIDETRPKVSSLADHLSFKKMKNNAAVNKEVSDILLLQTPPLCLFFFDLMSGCRGGLEDSGEE